MFLAGSAMTYGAATLLIGHLNLLSLVFMLVLVGVALAVLERRAGARLSDRDVYVSTVGAVRLNEPASDLAVALAVASAAWQTPLSSGTVAIGEVGLAGEIRNVVGLQRRLTEAARLGMTRAFVPAGDVPSHVDGLTVLQVRDIRDALAAAKSSA